MSFHYCLEGDWSRRYPTNPRYRSAPSSNGIGLLSSGLNLKQYASTGGQGFAQFDENDGKPADEIVLKNLLSLHEGIKARDLVFTRYSR